MIIRHVWVELSQLCQVGGGKVPFLPHFRTSVYPYFKNAWEADSKIFPELVARTESLLKFFNDSHGMHLDASALLLYNSACVPKKNMHLPTLKKTLLYQ